MMRAYHRAKALSQPLDHRFYAPLDKLGLPANCHEPVSETYSAAFPTAPVLLRLNPGGLGDYV
jgi:hypothetical protein